MNVFVLSTGRCGTETFTHACSHIWNYSCAHESQRPQEAGSVLPYSSLRYPDNHIEVDNRLAWFLGSLDKEYGDRAFYVHLIRERRAVASSLSNRGEQSILYAFASGVLQFGSAARGFSETERLEVAKLYWNTVNQNISSFLKGKSRKMVIHLSEIEKGFSEFWTAIAADGDFEGAVDEFSKRYNVTDRSRARSWQFSDSSSFVREAMVGEISLLVPEKEAFVLVDDCFFPEFSVAGRRRIALSLAQSVSERQDESALLTEIEGLLDQGLRYVFVSGACSWWFLGFGQLRDFLASRARFQGRSDYLFGFVLKW